MANNQIKQCTQKVTKELASVKAQKKALKLEVNLAQDFVKSCRANNLRHYHDMK